MNACSVVVTSSIAEDFSEKQGNFIDNCIDHLGNIIAEHCNTHLREPLYDGWVSSF